MTQGSRLSSYGINIGTSTPQLIRRVEESLDIIEKAIDTYS